MVTPTEQAQELREDLARTDTKASLLLAGAGALVAVLASGPLQTPGIAQWVTGAGMAVIAASAAVLLVTVRPRIGGPMLAGTPGWCPETAAARRDNLAELCRTKFYRLRRAIDLLLVGGGVSLVGVLLGVIV